MKEKLTKEEKLERSRKRRIEKKQSALFKECTDKFLKTLEDNGYHAIDLYRSSGYFIFNFGGNSVNTFWIKEVPGWRFGLWWTKVDKENGSYLSAEFFTQFEKDIDKFKPSRSTLLETKNFKLDKYGWKLFDYGKDSIYEPFKEYYDLDIKDMLKFLKEHPYRAWARSCTWEYDKYRVPWTGFKCWRKYVKNLWYHKKSSWFQNWADKKLLKWFEKKVFWILNDWGVYKHKNLSPAYEIYAPLTTNKEMFGKRGLYGLFLSKDEIEPFKNSGKEKLVKWAEESPKLEAKFKKKRKRLDKLSRFLGIWYYPEVDDSVIILNKKGYEAFKNGDLGI